MPALVRFSTASGNPGVHDGEREGRGIAVKFQLPGGGETDLLCVTSPTFLARNPEDFLELMKARLPDPETGAPDMEKVGAYLGAHPEAMPAVQANLGVEPPASFAQLAYNSLHSFRLIGARRRGALGPLPLGARGGGGGGSPTRRRRRVPPTTCAPSWPSGSPPSPAGFRLILVLGEEGDPTDDPTEPWPRAASGCPPGRSR